MNIDYLDYKNVSSLLELEEFEIMVNSDLTLSVVDCQGANLGGIEEERFNTFDELIDRMEIYHNDYIVRALEEELEIYDYEDWKDLYNKIIESEYYKEYKWDIDMLGLICGK